MHGALTTRVMGTNYKYEPLPSHEPKRHVHFRDQSTNSMSSMSTDNRSLSDVNEEVQTSRFCNCLRSRSMFLLNLTLLLVSISFFSVAVSYESTTLQHVRKYSAWSPAAAVVEYEHIEYNITTSGNRFTGASPEVDKAWREISYDAGDQFLAKSDFYRLGMPSTSLEVEDPRNGEAGYRVGVEVFHHLHCLNLLRRVTYKDYYEPLGGEFAAGPEMLRKHTDHCIEVLRLNLQCTADIGLFTFYMVDGDPLAWPQLNSRHVCRNFDKVKAWAVENSVGNMEVLQ